MNQRKKLDAPTLDQLRDELRRERHRTRYQRVFRSTVFTLVVVAAFAILAASRWFPVLEIYGVSMSPTLSQGDIVATVTVSDVHRGDLVAFYFGNRLLVKRCVALPGDEVVIDEGGHVSINGEILDEPYVSELSPGDCDLEFPFTVPQEQYFLLGDHRQSSIDSRNSVIGCVGQDQIVGKAIFRVWPMENIGKIGGSA